MRAAATALVLLLAFAQPASALPPEDKDWDVRLRMYGWALALDTTIAAGGVQTEIDKSFFSILGDLGWAVMGGVEGRWGRALLLMDVFGSQLVVDETGSPRTRDFQALSAGPGGELTFGEFDVHARLTTWFLDVKPGYRVLSLPMSKLTGGAEDPEDRRRLDVDLLAGLRYWNVTNKTTYEVEPASLTVGGVSVPVPDLGDRVSRGRVHFPGEVLRNGADRSVQDTVDWVDPLVGLRVTAGVTRRWSVFALGDVGGWDVGSASDLTWQAMGGSYFALSERWLLTAAYRAVAVEREPALDEAIMHGPQFGVEFRF